MVPFHNVDSVGLRRVVRNGEVQKILDFLTDGKCENHADWKYRFKENSDKMRTGSLLDVADGPERSVASRSGQAAQLPRKEDAGTRPLPAGQRAGDVEELGRAGS